MKQKVFHLLNDLNIGGIQNVVLNIVKTIDKKEYDLFVGIFGEKKGDLFKEFEKYGANIISLPAIDGKYLNYYQNLQEVLKKYGPFDVFHSHLHLSNGIALRAAKKSGIPIRVSHSHSVDRDSIKKPLKYHIYEHTMRKMIIKFGNVFLASSKLAGKYLYGNDFFETEGIVFPNSINIEKHQFSSVKRKIIRDKLSINNKIVIGTVGNLNEIKNHRLIIDITEELASRGAQVFTIIIGEGPLRRELTNRINEKELQNKVVLAGNKVNVSDYLNAMDVFVFPSLHEGLGISAIEAQANGLPVLISDKVPEEVIIKENVSTVSLESSVGIWADCVLDNINNRLNFQVKKLVEYGFSDNSAGKLIEDIYKQPSKRL